MPKRRPKSRPASVAAPVNSPATATESPTAANPSTPIVTGQSNSLATPLPGDDGSPVNDLARKIEPYTKPIAIAVAVLAAAVVGFTLYRSRQTENRSDATLQLARASATGNTDDLTSIAATYPGTPAAAWARLYEGSTKMAAGMTALFESRDEAEELLSDAEAAYRAALQTSRDRVLQSRAHYGLAQIAEARGEVDTAITSYEAAMSAGESDAMVEVAKERITLLKQPQSQEFLAWFKEQDFSPAEPSLPPALPELGDLPDEPDLGMLDLEIPEPQTTEDQTDADPAMTAEEIVTEQPKVEEPKVEEPKVEEPKVEEPKVEEPKVNEPVVDEVPTQEPAAEPTIADADEDS